MPRPTRLIIPGIIHHIVHRGNNKQTVFFDREDYELYLQILTRYSRTNKFKVYSYCLMPNHVHIAGVPYLENSIPGLMRDTQSRYSFLLNRKRGTCGHNWQDRYYSCPCDESHAVTAMRYTELNPVRAEMVRNAWEYEWSSAAAHTGIRSAEVVLDTIWWNHNFHALQWIELLTSQNGNGKESELRRSTRFGLPLGSKEFCRMIQKRYKEVPGTGNNWQMTQSGSMP